MTEFFANLIEYCTYSHIIINNITIIVYYAAQSLSSAVAPPTSF